MTVKYTRERWRYEPETKTIRCMPGNHWIAGMDSFDGAVDHNGGNGGGHEGGGQ